ncbi:MAG TPA: TIGR02186 family protein [Alphaproteobacteria bacterium]
MSIRLLSLVLLVLALAGVYAPARAQPLVFDLSTHLIEITTGFSGADMLLFGATEGEGDVVVVLRGPDQETTVRRKSRVGGIWINTDEMVFTGVPAFYRVASSRPLTEISPAIRARHQLGTDYLRLAALPNADASEVAEFRAGLLRNKERRSLYASREGEVSFLGPRLFRTHVLLPANVPPGSYTAEVLLIRNNQVVAAQTTPMFVSKIGVGADVYEFAHRDAAIYGILTIFVAVLAGWGAGVIFRKA